MVISDFVIISPHQFFARVPKETDVFVEATNRNFIYQKTIYKDGFFITQHFLRGIWYTVYPSKDKIYTDSFFDLDIDCGVYNVILRNSWRNTIMKVIDYFIDKEPRHSIFVLFRLGYPKCEIFHNCMSKYEFCSKMLEGKLHFDEIYYVSK